MLLKKVLTACCLYFISTSLSAVSENNFYILRFKTEDRVATPAITMQRLKNNFQKVSLLIAQAYYINQAGEVKGEIEPEILTFAKTNNIKLIALVTNSRFDSQSAHQFLMNKTAQIKAIKALIEQCKLNNLFGIQLDFEMVRVKDRDALTTFFLYAANELRANHLNVSFAVAPVVTNQNASAFLKKSYEVWQGAYDLKALEKNADFITIMSYNQHTAGTTPGTTASFPWMEEVIKYTLQFIPANKISLGIPVYSTYWRTGANTLGKIIVKMDAVAYEKAIQIIQDNHADMQWDKRAKINYAYFSRDWLNEYIFVEDKASFDAKYQLVKKYKLRGISVFDLGDEDPHIWNILK